jgi:hypothetical protein
MPTLIGGMVLPNVTLDGHGVVVGVWATSFNKNKNRRDMSKKDVVRSKGVEGGCSWQKYPPLAFENHFFLTL